MSPLFWWITGIALALVTIRSPFLLWEHYLMVMMLKRNKRNLKGLSLYYGGWILLRGYLLDAYVNVVILSFVLLEFPQELTVTSRLKRHYLLDGTWGHAVADYMAEYTDPYDAGHIRGMTEADQAAAPSHSPA